MNSGDDSKQSQPDASDTERTVMEQAKQQPEREPSEGGEPDEGIRPGQLSSENDGGGEG